MLTIKNSNLRWDSRTTTIYQPLSLQTFYLKLSELVYSAIYPQFVLLIVSIFFSSLINSSFKVIQQQAGRYLISFPKLFSYMCCFCIFLVVLHILWFVAWWRAIAVRAVYPYFIPEVPVLLRSLIVCNTIFSIIHFFSASCILSGRGRKKKLFSVTLQWTLLFIAKHDNSAYPRLFCRSIFSIFDILISFMESCMAYITVNFPMRVAKYSSTLEAFHTTTVFSIFWSIAVCCQFFSIVSS